MSQNKNNMGGASRTVKTSVALETTTRVGKTKGATNKKPVKSTRAFPKQYAVQPENFAGRIPCYIDEAGRWPLAGPVWVGIVSQAKSIWSNKPAQNIAQEKQLAPFRDSKQCSPAQRDEMYDALNDMTGNGSIVYASGHASAAYIDRHGIVAALRHSITQAVEKLGYGADEVVLIIDGNTDFGLRSKGFLVQSIIKWDSTVAAISAASIVAKVERDRYMVRIAKQYPRYGFEQHKGYGTSFHMEAIRKYGQSKEHRKSFIHLDE